MATPRLLDIHFPSGGLDRRQAYQLQPPFTTNSCSNVMPIGTYENRRRGGSRPGLGKSYYSELGGGKPIRNLSRVPIVDDSKFTLWADYFQGESIGNVWSTASWIGEDPEIFPVDVSTIVYEDAAGLVRDDISDLSTSSAYTIQLFIVPWQATHYGKYQIFARTGNPGTFVDGIIVELDLTDGNNTATTDGAFTGTLKDYSTGNATNTYNFTVTASPTGQAEAGWLSVLIDGNDITVQWLGNTVISAQTVRAHSGTQVGFGMTCTVAGGINLVDIFRVQYYRSTEVLEKRNYLIAISNGFLYREGNANDPVYGEMDLKFSNTSAAHKWFNPDENIDSVFLNGALYIADHGRKKAEATSVTIAVTNEISDASIVATGGEDEDEVDPEIDLVVVSNVTADTTAGTYTISAVVDGKVTLNSNIGLGTCDFYIKRGPKKYDPVAGTLALITATSGKGQIPTGCRIISNYRERLVFADDPDDSHNWYMSRAGTVLDWEYALDGQDVTQAIAGNNSDAGKIGEPISAIMPHGDDYLLMGGSNSLWVMRGDPAEGGRIDNLSREIGPIAPNGWCRSADNQSTIFLSHYGLYAVAVGADQFPQPISRDKLPRELAFIDAATTTISLAFDSYLNGVHIFLTPNDKQNAEHFFVDWLNQSFWIQNYQDDHEPFTVITHQSDSSRDRTVLIGCRDGYIREFNRDFGRDDGAAITSHVWYGPLRLGGNDFLDGVLSELTGVLGEQSETVTWNTYAADTPESVFDATAYHTGSWTAGKNFKVRPHMRGKCAAIKLSSTAKWVIESMQMVDLRKGGHRTS